MPSPAVFRKGHRRGVPSFGRGHLLRSHTCLAFGRYWRVAIELRPILQPTSLRARWTPRRDEFRVDRDDRRLCYNGSGLKIRRGQVALWASRRVGALDAVILYDGQKDPVPTMRSRDGLAWTARWMVRSRGNSEEAGIRGEPDATGWGKDSRVGVQGGKGRYASW